MSSSRLSGSSECKPAIGEFHRGAIELIDAGVPQPAFFLARQPAELALKARLGPEVRGHDLGRLPRRLEAGDDDLFAADDERRLVLEFIRDLHNRDPKGDQGRYPTTTSGALSPAAVCCAYPHLFRQYVDRLFAYTQERISHAGQSV